MKRTIFLALTIALVTLSASAQKLAKSGEQLPPKNGPQLESPDGPKKAQQWMKKKQDERKEYILKAMQLTEKERDSFLPVYEYHLKIYSASTKKMKDAARQMNDSCTDAQYQNALEIINNERANQAKYDANLYESMKKILPIRKIYLFYKADKEFNKLMMKDMKDHKKKDKK